MDCLDCKICNLPYDEDDHRPRNAPCGHDICSACTRALIINSIFQCPKCREKHKIDTPDNFPVIFGLIDVIRALKSIYIPLAKHTEAITPGASNDEVCNIHGKPISHWCFKCQIKICDDCTESHSSALGCSTASLTKAMEIKKENHLKDKDMILKNYEEDANYVSTELQKNTKLVEEHTKLAEKHGEEAKKLRKILDEGSIHKKHFEDSVKKLRLTDSPNSLDDGIRELTQSKQFLQSWSVRNLGTNTFLRALKDKKYVFAELDLNKVKKNAKLSQQEKHIYFHSFLKQAVPNGSIIMPFNQLQKLIPKDPSLVFLEVSIGGIVMGCMLVRLDKGLPKIKENFVNFVTGQKGQTLSGREFNDRSECCDIRITSLMLKEISSTSGSHYCSAAKLGDLIGTFCNGYLVHLYFYTGTSLSTAYSSCYLIGNIEAGIDIVRECYDNYNKGVKISDCGLVLEQE